MPTNIPKRKFRKSVDTLTSPNWYEEPGWTRFLLPGAQLDYKAKAGAPWLCSPLAIGLAWIARNIVEPPLSVFKNGNRQESHRLIDFLIKGSTRHSYQQWFAALIQDLLLFGNCYLVWTRQYGSIFGFEYKPFQKLTPVWKTNSWIDGYKEYTDVGTQIYLPEEVLHIKDRVDPKQPRMGMSAIESQYRKIVGANSADGYESSLLHNHAVPSVVISSREANSYMAKDDRDELKAKWEGDHGRDNANRASVVGSPIDVTRVGFSPAELSIGTMADSFEMSLVSAIGLNSLVLGLRSSMSVSTFNNYGEAQKHAYNNCLIPNAKIVCRAITESEIGQELLEPGEELGLDWTPIQAIQEDRTATQQTAALLFEKNLISRHQALRMCGIEQIENDQDTYAFMLGASNAPNLLQ